MVIALERVCRFRHQPRTTIVITLEFEAELELLLELLLDLLQPPASVAFSNALRSTFCILLS